MRDYTKIEALRLADDLTVPVHERAVEKETGNQGSSLRPLQA